MSRVRDSFSGDPRRPDADLVSGAGTGSVFVVRGRTPRNPESEKRPRGVGIQTDPDRRPLTPANKPIELPSLLRRWGKAKTVNSSLHRRYP